MDLSFPVINTPEYIIKCIVILNNDTLHLTLLSMPAAHLKQHYLRLHQQ